ncbi:MAG: type II toxin-antitoxin system ParD family antitoxin [Thermomicrobiales bacterium]
MSRQLPRDQEALVERIVETGQYDDADEVVDAALRLLEDRERRLQWLRAELAIGEEQEKRGELIEYTPDFMDRLMREADEEDRRGVPIKDAVKP